MGRDVYINITNKLFANFLNLSEWLEHESQAFYRFEAGLLIKIWTQLGPKDAAAHLSRICEGVMVPEAGLKISYH